MDSHASSLDEVPVNDLSASETIASTISWSQFESRKYPSPYTAGLHPGLVAEGSCTQTTLPGKTPLGAPIGWLGPRGSVNLDSTPEPAAAFVKSTFFTTD